MKQNLLIGIIVIMIGLLTACGEASSDDVMSDLDTMKNELTSYEANAKMTIHSGEESQSYDLGLWYKSDNYYKVEMNNPQDERGNQIIVRNDEGVFVLTPSLNKSYQFQNDWPNNNHQPYLFQTLIEDIQEDPNAEFRSTEHYYVFSVQTNYKGNKHYPTQEIFLEKDSHQPVLVRVLNESEEAMVEVEFTSFDMNIDISDEEFDTDYNLAEETIGVSALDEAEEQEVFYPLDVPSGSTLMEEEIIDLENGERIILSYDGEKHFTLVQEWYDIRPPHANVPVYTDGEMIDFGATVGSLKDKTLEWSHGGREFILASEDLTVAEMVDIAQSVYSESMK